MTRMKIGYLAFEASDPRKWHRFCVERIGLPEPITNVDGSAGYRIDAAAQRLIVLPGRSDDLAAIGLELPDDAEREAWLARIARSGTEVMEGDDALRRTRRVREIAWFHDPAGNRIEAFGDPELSDEGFASPHFPGGFRTGDLGIGHAVLVHHDLEAMERFYVGLLGFRVTERLATRIGPIEMRGTFLHCNRRHHSLALFDVPIRKRLHHFMLEASSIADVGTAYERARRLGVPLSLRLGQHPSPDGTISFYGTTPSGFDFEIGAGSGEIDPGSWASREVGETSSWGHEPTLRLKLKTLGALLSSRFA